MKTEGEIKERLLYLEALRRATETMKESHMYTDMITELKWVLS